jgi:hypothetical protein
MATIFSISVVWIHHYFKVVRNQPRPKGLANEKEAFGNASRKIAQSPVSKLLLASHYSCELRLLSTPLLADRPSCHHSNHSYVFPRSRVESQPLQPLLLRSTKEDQDVTASNEPQEVRTPDRSVPTNSKKTEPLFVLPSPSEQGEARSPVSSRFQADDQGRHSCRQIARVFRTTRTTQNGRKRISVEWRCFRGSVLGPI